LVFADHKNDWLFYIAKVLNDQNELKFQEITKTVRTRRETLAVGTKSNQRTSVSDVLSKKNVNKLPKISEPVLVDENKILDALNEKRVVDRLEETCSILRVHQDIDHINESGTVRNRSGVILSMDPKDPLNPKKISFYLRNKLFYCSNSIWDTNAKNRDKEISSNR
jgi:hypothetical protein